MCLLIPTHALPSFGYRVPVRLAGEVEVGSAVVAPLSGYSRLGFVVSLSGNGERPPTEEISSVESELSLGPEMIEVCERVSEAAAVPLASVLRAALPPGLNASRYRVVAPAPDWRWKPGRLLGRATLRRALGGEGLKLAETEGRIALAPQSASNENGSAAWLEAREETDAREISPFREDARRATGERAPFIWRVPTRDQARAASALAREAVDRGEQSLILAPEKETVERVAGELARALPPGTTVAPYHSEMGKDRAAVYRAARSGDLDVIVGTRAAALLPLHAPGVICVVDEPDSSHRAEPGYEGVPLHVRDLTLHRVSTHNTTAVFLSPTPSLSLYARRPGVRELAPRRESWRSRVKIVDMRGTGAALSPTLIEVCRHNLEEGRSVGVVASRVGYATVVSCGRCGAARSCPDCDLPMAFHKQTRSFVCNRCGKRERADDECPSCGARRLAATGLAAERVWEEISEALGEEAGLLTADLRRSVDAPVVVGSARYVLRDEWDALALPDVDGLLLGSGVGAAERAFRLAHRAREAAREELVVQTRSPEHYALRAALRGDYPSFAAAELSRRRDLGYPPYSHVAALTLEGSEESVRSAVKSRLRPVLSSSSSEVEMSEPVPSPDDPRAWRVLLRGRDRALVAEAGAEAARTLARKRGGVKARVEVDPEEV